MAEVGQDISIGDRDYHISKFHAKGELHGVLSPSDPESPFTVATWGGYSVRRN